MNKDRGYSDEDMREVLDNPEWTEDDFRRARPMSEAFPDIVEALRRARGPQKAPTKQLISLRLDRDVIARFRATGPGWQGRMNDALREAIGKRDA